MSTVLNEGETRMLHNGWLALGIVVKQWIIRLMAQSSKDEISITSSHLTLGAIPFTQRGINTEK